MRRLGLVIAAVLLLTACSSSTGDTASRSPADRTTPATRPTTAPSSITPSSAAASGSSAPAVPRFAHIVVVIEENHASSQIIGSRSAPYMNALARSGLVLSNSFGIGHPSQPNYLALFSGSAQGITNDSCPHTFGGANLASELLSHGRTFAGYSQGLPATGYTGCWLFEYARKHAPWTDFSNVPASVDRPMSAFPRDYNRLPTVSFVVPDLEHDMHDGTVAAADTWLRTNLSGYVTWARTHNSLFVLTWDEDDNGPRNQIPGVLAGAHLAPGSYSARVDHYAMLRTIEAAYGLPGLGQAAARKPISGIWRP
jgi:phosphatidylinositol-3-phosphatase